MSVPFYPEVRNELTRLTLAFGRGCGNYHQPSTKVFNLPFDYRLGIKKRIQNDVCILFWYTYVVRMMSCLAENL